MPDCHRTLDCNGLFWRMTYIVTTELLGTALVPNAPFVQPDGTPYRLDKDYSGAWRRQPGSRAVRVHDRLRGAPQGLAQGVIASCCSC